MPSAFEQVIDALAPDLGRDMARRATADFLSRAALDPATLGSEHLPDLANQLRAPLTALVGTSRTERIIDAIHRLEHRPGEAARGARLLDIMTMGVLLAAAVLAFGPWYHTVMTHTFFAMLKPLCLIAAAGAAFMCYEYCPVASGTRRSWIGLGVGFALFAVGQSVLAFYQVDAEVHVPFPSVGDVFFVTCYLFLVPSLFSFAVTTRASGLPLGTSLAFWSPALVVALAYLAGLYPMLRPVLEAGTGWKETFLNIYYPTVSFMVLAPSLVMLRVSLRFRGGRLRLVWKAIAAGFALSLVSDVLFAYLTSETIHSLLPMIDFLYLAGYLLIARGILLQFQLMEA